MGREEEVEAEKLVEEARRLLERLRGVNETEAVLRFLAWLNGVVSRLGGRIIITGGFAAEVYSGRAYRTLDVDIIVEDGPRVVKLVEGLLKRLGDRPAREYLVEGLPKAIDIVATTAGSRRLVELETPEGVVYIESPEDTIAAYLRGWKYWGSLEDRDKALAVLTAWLDRLDLAYLRRLAERDSTTEELRRLLEEARKIRSRTRQRQGSG